ncbi:NAD(P)-dependent oxidoreductase [Hymenobacter sp. BT175]|uniref:NAD-dependent epimerase/dehydratase family protein n=1 Tax=Hymenobacter translucens TaxID=2886507 RepID=UPI001D0ECE77|nr:NAD(P)-dependent oxidoreductase [Hymenobacter translucens]MCC2547916.1 NAD(P)-dependent oxidoreductase [Hymenobacter translucens]
MHIAILGSTSLLASYLIEQLLLDPTVDLTLYGRRPPAEMPARPQVEFRHFDYPAKPIDPAELLAFDALIYCTASGVQASDQTSEEAIWGINSELPISLLRYLTAYNYRGKWISFGTYFEIGASRERRPMGEEEVLLSTRSVPNSYCESKRRLSAFVRQEHFAFTVWHLILPTIYGARENANRLIPYLVRTLQAGEMPRLSAGTQVRQYIHGREVAGLATRLLTEPIPTGIYNVAGPDVITIRELVEVVFSEFGQSAAQALGAVTTRDECMGYLALDDTKLHTYLPDWRPQTQLVAGIKEYIVSLDLPNDKKH